MTFEERRTKITTEFWEITNQSWTYEKLTSEEKNELTKAIAFARLKLPKRATEIEMYDMLYACYRSFLFALGYDKNPVHWREQGKETL